MTKLRNLLTQSDDTIGQELEVYRPPPPGGEPLDIVDVVCRIMDDDDGPRPMKDLRPTQKHRNAVDQFYSDHQEVYEARGAPSRDKMEAVRLHNSGYPKMHDELNRRRSTAKVTAVPAQRVTATQHRNYARCNTFMTTRKKAEPRRRTVGVKLRSRELKNRSDYKNNSKITKLKCRRRRNPSSCKIYKLSKIRMNRGCQCSTYYLAKDKKSGTDKIITDEKMAVEEGSFHSRDLNRKCSTCKQQHCNNSSKEGSSTRNALETDASVSSYNSYTSMEHEPMVSE